MKLMTYETQKFLNYIKLMTYDIQKYLNYTKCQLSQEKTFSNPQWQYRKATEPTVRLNGLMKNFNLKVVRP